MQQEYALSERRACGLVLMAVSSYRYVGRRSDEALRTRLVELAREKPRFGYRRLHVLLRRTGERVNHKRLQCDEIFEEGLAGWYTDIQPGRETGVLMSSAAGSIISTIPCWLIFAMNR
jgi:hypothetical protein